MNNPKAVLFDFDGVVVNSFKVHYTAWCNAYRDIFKKEAPAFPTASHAGKAPILIAEYFCKYGGNPNQAEELNHLKAEYLHNSNIAPDLLPGVREITKLLKSRAIPFGIASNATKQFIQNSINQLDLDFEIFTGVEDYKFPKPHPEAYLSLANKLNVRKEDLKDAWVFEDSVTGINAAKAANMFPAGILTQQSKEALLHAGSKIQFPTLFEAHQFIRKL